MRMTPAFHHLTIIFLALLSNNQSHLKVNAKDEIMHNRNTVITKKRSLLGGYNSVQDASSEEIATAAQTAFEQLKLDGPTVSYASAIRELSVEVVPIEVSQQVVAGLNLRMKLGFFKKDTTYEEQNCIGGITVTVFRNLNGEYSVQNWGKPIDCSQVVTLLNEHEADE